MGFVNTELFRSLYHSPRRISSRGSFELCAAVRANTGDPRVVVLPVPDADMDAVRKAFDRIERAHAIVAGGAIPAVAERGELQGVPYLAYACDAVVDAAGVFERLSARRLRVPYATGMACLTDLMQIVRRAHAFVDDETGNRMCIGSLSWNNMLVGPSGQHWLIGFGHNVVTRDEFGRDITAVGVFQSPEVGAGAPATPGADLYALTLLARSFMPYTDFPLPMQRVLQGRPLPEDQALVEYFNWVNGRVLAGPATGRPTLDEAIAAYAQVWTILGVKPSLGEFRELLVRALGEEDRRIESTMPERQLLVGADGDWIAIDGNAPTMIRTRRALRRIVQALAEAAINRPSSTLDVSQLLEIGWPGESPLPDAGANRVYVAVSTLRKIGMKSVLQRSADGYRIDPKVRVRLVDDSSQQYDDHYVDGVA